MRCAGQGACRSDVRPFSELTAFTFPAEGSRREVRLICFKKINKSPKKKKKEQPLAFLSLKIIELVLFFLKQCVLSLRFNVTDSDFMSRISRKPSANPGNPAVGFLRKATHEQLAEQIERDLRRGMWKDVMPSVRTLTRHYGSNLITTFKATQILLGLGMLTSQGPKRRYLINANLRPDRDQAGFNKIALIVAASKKTKSRPVAVAKLISDKEHFCLVDLGAHSLEGYKRELGIFFADHKPSHVILIGGDPEHLAFLDELKVNVSLLHLDTVDWAPAFAQLP